jgi:hypothetical protein
MEKVAQTGLVTLRQAGRSMLVEPADTGAAPPPAPLPAPAPEPEDAGMDSEAEAEEQAPPAVRLSNQEGIRAVRQALMAAAEPPRWPLYARQARQFLRAAIEGFDERAYGFASVTDLLRAAGKEGVLRVERDRQGAVRVFPGANLVLPPAPDGEAGAEATAGLEAAREASAGDAGQAPASEDAQAPKKKATRARKSPARRTGATKKAAGTSAGASGTRKRAAKKTKAADAAE